MTTSAGPPADVLSALRVVGRGTPDSKRRVQCFCPFHTERTGSFYLYPSGGGKCFGECNAWFSPKKMRELLDLPDISKPPGQRAPEITYDYPDAEGATLFQVVKYYDIQGKKRFYQRRPDPARPGSWINDLNTVLPVLYRLPELNGADPEAWVFIPEGEKDADRLAAEGLVTTTSPMGAGKWMARYAAALKRRRVAIIPDNDGPGREHAESILATVHPVAAAVKVIRLPDLPNHGDVSDWLDAGHEVDELLEIVEQAPAAVPMQRNGNGSGNGVATLQELEESTDLLWPGNKWYPYSQRIINKGLLSHGYFLSASGRYYFFDQETKILCELDSFDMAKILSRRYRLNLKESLYIYLVADMKVEAATNGVQATIHQLTYYDAQNNLLYVDMGNGAYPEARRQGDLRVRQR